jgi:hypothetical protein
MCRPRVQTPVLQKILIIKIKYPLGPSMVAYACNPNTKEAKQEFKVYKTVSN